MDQFLDPEIAKHIRDNPLAVDLSAVRDSRLAAAAEAAVERLESEVDAGVPEEEAPELVLTESDQALDALLGEMGQEELARVEAAETEGGLTIEEVVTHALGVGLSEEYVVSLAEAMMQYQAACIVQSNTRTSCLQLFLRGVSLGRRLALPEWKACEVEES